MDFMEHHFKHFHHLLLLKDVGLMISVLFFVDALRLALSKDNSCKERQIFMSLIKLVTIDTK